VQVGQVFNLPKIPESSDSIIHRQMGRDENPWNHPVVVIRKWVGDGGEELVDIRMCTTFGGARIENHKVERQWGLFALADNDQDRVPHPNGRFATMAPSSDRFKKRTYINLSPGAAKSVEYRFLTSWVTASGMPIQFDKTWAEEIRIAK
jgi:hypothetical protein